MSCLCAARKLAREFLAPHVARMDQESEMTKEVLSGLFQHGLMGIEIEKKYGGMGSSFFASCLAVEELAMIDPAVCVCARAWNWC